jgi:hypothetical protein
MKFNVEDDTVDKYAVSIAEMYIDRKKDYALDVVECPFCHGIFGVDWTYLEQVDNTVHCPMCCMEVTFADWE